MADTDPVRKMINNSNRQVKNTIKDYNDCVLEFDDFLNTTIDEIGGTAEIKAKSVEEKALYIAEHNLKKGREVEGKFADKNTKLNELKEIAEKILTNQKELIEQNKSLLEELQNDLNADLGKISSLEQYIQIDNDNISVLDGKISSRETLISTLTTEINDLRAVKVDIENKESELATLQTELNELKSKSRPNHSKISAIESSIEAIKDDITQLKKDHPDYDSIDIKESERSQLQKEKRDFEDKKIEISTDKLKKEGEKNNLVSEKGTKESDLNDLKAKNEKLEKNMNKNYETLKENLKEIEIDNDVFEDKDHSSTPGGGAPGGGAPGGGAPGGGAPGGGAPGGGVPGGGAPAQTALTNLTDREVARKICKNYVEATSMEEKKALINGTGYKTLVETGRNLRGMDRRRFYNSLAETRDQLSVPDYNDFEDRIEDLLGDKSNAKQLYGLLFDNDGKARNFRGMRNSLSKSELRQVKDFIDTLGQKREELAESDPELIEFFDNNFVSFVRMNTLMEKTSRRGPFKATADFFGMGKGSVCNLLSDVVVDYNGKRVEDEKKRFEFMNSMRQKLGQQTIDMDNLDEKAKQKLMNGNEHFRGNRAPQRDEGSR